MALPSVLDINAIADAAGELTVTFGYAAQVARRRTTFASSPSCGRRRWPRWPPTPAAAAGGHTPSDFPLVELSPGRDRSLGAPLRGPHRHLAAVAAAVRPAVPRPVRHRHRRRLHRAGTADAGRRRWTPPRLHARRTGAASTGTRTCGWRSSRRRRAHGRSCSTDAEPGWREIDLTDRRRAGAGVRGPRRRRRGATGST